MMDIILVLAISVFLQLATVFLSLKLIHLTGARTAWLLTAIAFALIAFWQLIKAIRFISGDLSPLLDLSEKLLTVAVSVIIVAGISSIAPAGGLAAFAPLFCAMPTDTDPAMAFALAQHLAPDHKIPRWGGEFHLRF